MTANPKPNVYQRLLKVQVAVDAPRTTQGKFGPTRSAEQILAEAKAPCDEHGLLIRTSERIEIIEERRYMVCEATAVNVDDPSDRVDPPSVAHAWEGEVEFSRQGAAILDPAQVTGKASSYAKKYALCHLLNIGAEKDADHDQEGPQTRAPGRQAQAEPEPEPAADKGHLWALRERAEAAGAGERLAAFVAERYGKGTTLTVGQGRTIEAWVIAQEKAAGIDPQKAATPSEPTPPATDGPAAPANGSENQPAPDRTTEGAGGDIDSLRTVAVAELEELGRAVNGESLVHDVMDDLAKRHFPSNPGAMSEAQLRTLIGEVLPAHTPF